METIETETLNYIRLALYGLAIKDISLKIGINKTTVTHAIRNGIATKETLAKLLALALEVSPNLPIPELA